MTPEDVYQFFGSGHKAALALDISRYGFSKWITAGRIPFKRQVKIEKITKGKLKANTEDAKKINPKDIKELNYFPNFRYYDKKNGLCRVESLHFRKGKPVKIVYVIEGNKREKFTSFLSENLMEAYGIIDLYSKPLFEGDIVQFKNGDQLTFQSKEEMIKLKKKNGQFKIIGNIFE